MASQDVLTSGGKSKPYKAGSKLGPSSPSMAFQIMEPRLDKVNALWGGTAAMREAGETYLPKYAQESLKNWRARRDRAVLFNYFKKVCNALSGKPFSRELELKEADPRIEELEDDIDLQGNSLHVFAQRRFIEALQKGMSHWLIEYPEVEAENAADELAQGARPFWLHIPPETLLAAYTGIVDGISRVIYARILYCEVEREGFGEVTTERVKEYVSGEGKTVVNTYLKNGKVWQQEGSSEIPMPYVPLITFYAGEKEGDFIASLPLGDLADKNIEHWQSSSDQRHCLTVARFPMLAGKGIQQEEGQVVKVGPYETLFAENPNSQFYFVEHTGAAIAAGRTDLEDIKAEMAILAMEMIASRSNRMTATEVAKDSGEANSVLQMLAVNFEDVLEQALVVTAEWMGLEPALAGEIELNTQFDLTGLDAKGLDALIAARNAGDLSAEDFLKELHRRGILQEACEPANELPPGDPKVKPGVKPMENSDDPRISEGSD